ncbi:MAG: HEAT repeat domain-containing protein [Candidatus Cloacimonetes bacterium]|nr:HEAT repeat domain-containing protein [Candidatus Cloacimonadota bacterium]
MKKIFILLIFMSINFSLNAEVLKDAEIELIETLLEQNDMSLQSLNFLKDWAKDTKFKLPVVVDILNNPLQFPKFVDQTEELCEKHDPSEMICEYADILFQAKWIDSFDETVFEEYFTKNVKTPRDIFGYVEYVWEFVDHFYQKAWQKLSQEDKEMLHYFSYSLWEESEDSLRYDEFYQNQQITEYDSLSIEKDVIPILEKIDFPSLMYAANISQNGFDILQQNLALISFQNDKKLIHDSPFGLMCIGSPSADRYDKHFSFILDPAGNDMYAAPIKTDWEQTFYWIVDMQGNDTYRNDMIGNLFHVFAGIGISCDMMGDDVYSGDDYTLSSFLGYLLAHDMDGNDIYDGGLNSIAAATFGLNLLIDEKGCDHYSTTELGEGFAGPLAAGFLIDTDGSDMYYAGGKYLHVPLAPFDHRALSQGFGFGVRPYLGGGIGVLYDQSGNDVYQGAVYSQAVAYWYALGIIIDKAGNDFYTAVYYPQGSGIHLAGGFLYDEEGEDHYYSKHGPGQGAAHDYAVGYLIDRKGNDIYSVEGGNGLGLTNSVALFLDASGDDRYERNMSSNYGYANTARNTGSIGIFLDTGGTDIYPISSDTSGYHEKYKNDMKWSYGTYGVGWDTLMVVQEIAAVEEKAEEDAATVDSLASIKEIFSIASEWGVGSSAKRVAKAAEILLKRDTEASEYIFENKLDTKGSLEYRAILNFAKKSSEFGSYLPQALANEDSVVVKNALALIGELRDTTLIDTLSSMLDQKKFVPSVLSALGKMKTDNAVQLLEGYMNSPSERVRVIVARGFLLTDTLRSNELLSQMKDDTSFLIRTMYKLKKK